MKLVKSLYIILIISLVGISLGCSKAEMQFVTGGDDLNGMGQQAPEGTQQPGPSSTPMPSFSLYDEAELLRWYRSFLTRGDMYTRGDPSSAIVGQRNKLPAATSQGYRVIVCAGAGCPIKMPFVFTHAHLQTISNNMAAERIAKNCTADTPECERVALMKAMVDFEMIMHDNKLKRLPYWEYIAYSIDGHSDFNSRLTLDCVDQAVNGISYLYILARLGLIKHHRIIYPGQINIGVIQPHFFTRIEDTNGKVYRFDLFHRGQFGIAPYVLCMNC